MNKKHTGKISIWGWVSLVGIVVSTVCGVGAQIKESSDDASKALAIAKKSDETLKQVRRILTPIDDPKIRLHFVLDCKQRPEYNDWCKKSPAQNGSSFGSLGVAILFFADPKTAQAFIDREPNSFDASFLTQLPADSSPLESGHATFIITNKFQPVDVSKRGNFNSIVDFPGATLILMISRGSNELAGLRELRLPEIVSPCPPLSIPACSPTRIRSGKLCERDVKMKTPRSRYVPVRRNFVV